MAKKTQSIAFTNAIIDLEEGTITEIKKEEMIVSSLQEVLKEWDGIEGVCITIKRDTQCAVEADVLG